MKDEDIAALFSGASLFVYPSQYEGFGIPPIEAMACGVPTITSDNSSLPEAVGDASVMVDAKSVPDITKAIERVLSDKDLQKNLLLKATNKSKNTHGFTNLKNYSIYLLR